MTPGVADVFRHRRHSPPLSGRVEPYVRVVGDGDDVRLVGAVRPSRTWQALAAAAPLFAAAAVAFASVGDLLAAVVMTGMVLTVADTARRARRSRAGAWRTIPRP